MSRGLVADPRSYPTGDGAGSVAWVAKGNKIIFGLVYLSGVLFFFFLYFFLKWGYFFFLMGYFFLTFLLLFPYFRKTGKDRKRSKKERAREKSGAPGTARDRGCSVSAQVAPSAPGVWAARCVCRDMSECLWISRRSMAAGLGQLPLGGQSGFSFVLFLLFLLFSYFSLK